VKAEKRRPVSKKKNQQTFEKLKREQAVKEKRARKQEAKKAARELKAAIRRGEAVPAEETPGELADLPAE
jgi:hypothetical protein